MNNLPAILLPTLLVVLTLLSVVKCQWPGPPYPKTVGTGSDNCTQWPCEGFITYAPPDQRVPPYFPKQFTCHVSGVLVFPFTIQSLNDTHVQIAQEATFHYDWVNDRLKFDNNLHLGINISNGFMHTGDRMYVKTFGVCFCTNIDIGIVNYDSFADAEYLGRENKFVEYLWKNYTADHYLKGPHHMWYDVETRLPIRQYQPTNGLQVYYDWNNEVDPSVFDIPKFCIKYNCTDNPRNTTKATKQQQSSILTSSDSEDHHSKKAKADKLNKVSACPMKKLQEANQHDMSRAVKPKPGQNYKANTFSMMSDVLNHHLKKSGMRTLPCHTFNTSTLNELGRLIRSLALPDFQTLYSGINDRRSLKHEKMEDQEELWKRENLIVDKRPHLYNISRDGKCHELVMWYVHHLTESTQNVLKNMIIMPELPSENHSDDSDVSDVKVNEKSTEEDHLHSIYLQRIACTACHRA